MRPVALDDDSEKPVPAPMHSLDKERILRSVPERSSEIEDELLYGLRLDVGTWPDGIEQLVMRHQLSGVLHQIAQNRERLGRQEDALVVALIPVAPKTLVDGVEPERRKLLHNRTLATDFSSPVSPSR